MDQCEENSRPSTTTCLSDDNHDCDIKDYMLHYLGCLEICDRETFFDEGNPLWNREVEHQKKFFNSLEEAEDHVHAKRKSWKENCRSELRRIEFLRKTLNEDENDHHLVEQLSQSASRWRNSAQGKLGAVRAWRRKNKKKIGVRAATVEIKETGKYEPEKDVSVPIITFENGKGVHLTDPRVWNKFPNQKTTLSKLLDDDEELLLRQDDSSQFRYFHIPSNNMIVSFIGVWPQEITLQDSLLTLLNIVG